MGKEYIRVKPSQMNLMQVGGFYGITNVLIVWPELPIFLYSSQTMSSCDILAYITVGGEKTQPALCVPFSAFRHNENVNMLNTHSLSSSLASLFLVLQHRGEGRLRLQTRDAAC